LNERKNEDSDDRKKGDFDQARKHDIGGISKQHGRGHSRSRTAHKQNAARRLS